jgi:hypothetical protein
VNRNKLISIFSYLIGIIILIFVCSSSFSLIVFAQTLPPPHSSSSTTPQSKSYTSTNSAQSSSANISDSQSPPTPLLNKLQTKVVPKLLEKLSSLSNVVAISTVDGIKFSGINIGANTLNVTLSGQPIISNTTSGSNVSSTSLPVTVFVSKLPINNLTDIMSMVQSSRNLATSLGSINLGGGGPTVDLGTILSSNPAVQGNALQILSTLKNVQIGIGAFVHPNWNSAQTISLRLIGLPGGTTPPSASSTDVILVAVLPYRGAASLPPTAAK